MQLAKGSFRFLIILMLTLVPGFVAAITIVAVPVESSIAPYPRPAAVAPQDNVSTTFQPTLVYVQVSTITTTVTSTVTTTSVSTSVSTSQIPPVTTTTTAIAAATSINTTKSNSYREILIGILIGAVIGVIIGAVAMHLINTSKSNTYRTAGGLPPPPPQETSKVKSTKSNVSDRTMGGFCGKCGGPAKDNICVGCGKATSSCTCGPAKMTIRPEK